MLLAIVFALIAAILIFLVLSNSGGSDKTVVPGAATVNVVTAGGDIAALTTLSADMLKVTAVPADLVLSGSYSDAAALAGLTTRYPMAKGEQFTTSKIGETQKNDKSLARVVPPGKRAIAIPASQQSIVGGLILPGDIVDIIAVFTGSDPGVDKAVTILQNVEVLAVAQRAQEAVPPPVTAAGATPGAVRLGQTPEDTSAQPDAGTVTVVVTPEQAQVLALAADKAKLVLTLRPRGDTGNVQLGESSLSGLGIVP